MTSTSKMMSTPKGGKDLTVGAAVLVADVENKSHVHIEDVSADGKQAAKLTAGQVNITADSTQEYARWAGILDDWEKMYADLIAIGKDSQFEDMPASDKAAYHSNLEQIGKTIQDLNGIKKVIGVDPTAYTTNLAELPTSALGGAAQIASLLAGM